MRQVFAVIAAFAIMIGSTVSTFAQQSPRTTTVNGVNMFAGQVGGLYTSTMSQASPMTYHSLGMSFEVWTFDGAAGQCVDITMRSNTLAPALQLSDNPGVAPVIMQDQGRGSMAEIQVRLPRTGNYYLTTIAGTQGATEGTYTLAISPCQAAPARDPALGPDGKPWRAHY